MASHAGEIAGSILRRLASLSLAAAVVVAGCTSGELPRLPRTQADLIKAREADQQQQEVGGRDAVRRVVALVKARYDASAVGRAAAPPVLDVLVISGGGDWGAFGAGFLKGWGRVTGTMARPQFDVVTGVSTGALIAPFAFLGDEPSIDRIVELYRNPRKDWLRPRGVLAFLTGGASYGEIPGLEKDINKTLDETMMRRLVEAGQDGRLLAVSTSNLDFGEAHVWDLVAEARRALETSETDRVHRILLASSAIPGVFPPRLIDGGLYVDGAITGNIVYGGRLPSEADFIGQWKRLYPDAPLPRTRYWIIFNNEVRPPPEVVQPNWRSVMRRSMDTSTRSATINAMRHLFALADVVRLQYGADVEVRYIAVPDDWAPPKPGVFDREVMNALADMGESMGADPASWRTDPP